MYNGHCETGYCPITDEEIENSKPFSEHTEKFQKWSNDLWDKPRNAYHIKYLADIMEKCGWIGPPAKIWCGPYRSGQVCDGNHRIRACQYLLRKKHIVIEIRIELIL